MLTVPSIIEAHAIEVLRQEELEEARSIQSVMLPPATLRSGSITIAHEFQPVHGVGGDFLDYFQLGDGCVGLYIGDVSGKGLPAAMYATLAVGILRGIHKTGKAPSQVLSILNQRLTSRGILRRHAATQYAVFNPKNLEMTIASAGMPSPIHFSGNGWRVLDVSGIPPGLFPNADYDSATITIQPGDSILFSSDGIVEAQNARYEDFGIARLIKICRAGTELTPSELLRRIFSEVHSFTEAIQQHDDMAAAVFHLGR